MMSVNRPLNEMFEWWLSLVDYAFLSVQKHWKSVARE